MARALLERMARLQLVPLFQVYHIPGTTQIRWSATSIYTNSIVSITLTP